MARRLASLRAQRGVALLGLLAVAVMMFGYVLASRLNAASQFVAVNREANARVLAQAKQALIGWMAINAASNDTNPGRLPCPEAPAFFGDPAQEGIAAGNCTLPAVGRLPWRTLGLDKLVDSAGEPLWYVVSPGWAIPSAGATLTINADILGQLALGSDEAVALVIAPGPVMSVQAATGCTAWTQTRPATGAPDLRNYLECENANSPADTSFVGSRPGVATFNDQVLRISSADLMPALEAAIADRMQRQIAPAIKAAAYTSATYTGIPAGALLYPSPVPFSNHCTSSYQITGFSTSSPYNTIPPYPDTGNPQGLLPVSPIGSGCTPPPVGQTCPPSPPSPPPTPSCTPLPVSGTVRALTGFNIGGYLGPGAYSCTDTGTELRCQGQYHEEDSDPTDEVRLEVAATFANVAMGFRALSASPLSYMTAEARDNDTTGAWVAATNLTPVQIKMNDGLTALPDGTTPPRGSVTIRFRATMPNIDVNGWETYADFRMRLDRAVFDDHALLKKTDATLGWFVRNEWYRNVYYAVAKPNTAQWLPSLGCSAGSGDCIRFNDSATYNIRALLVLAGRRLPTQGARPSSDPLAYVEPQNGDDGTRYEQHVLRMSNVATSTPFTAPWNDRVILVDWDSASPPNALQAVNIAPLRLVSLP